jgi:putative membrane protein
MKQFLSEQERIRLDERIAAAEKRTGVQIVLAVIERSDSYPELPWKAFALGAASAGFAACLLDLLEPGAEVLYAVTSTLVVGAAAALLCVFMPKFARLFLDAHRAEMEVHQYAGSLFLSREIFATHNRTGLLLLVSLFERRIVVLPDRGLSKRLSQDALQEIIAHMTTLLASGPVAAALDAGLGTLEQVLAATAGGQAGENELPDEIVQEEGV